MTLHYDKKVVCLKNLQSNLIEEAFFVLKNDSNESFNENEDSKKGLANNIILYEAQSIVDEFISKTQQPEEDTKDAKDVINWKKELIYVTGLLIILGICISVVI